MTTETTNKMANVNNEVKSEETKKRVRRGLGEVRGSSRAKFTENDYNKSNGLFVGHLDSVELTFATMKEDSGLVSFAGLEVPSLVFTFASNDDEANKRKYITLRINPAESNANTIPGGEEEWKVNQPLNWLKHILDVFVLKGQEMTEEMADKLELPYIDFDENMEYVPIEPEVVLSGWRVLFENYLAILNNDGKPHYKSTNGKLLPIWMKLLRFVKNKKNEWTPVARGNNAGDFAFPAVVGEGVIELYNNTKTPTIHINRIKESVAIQQMAKQPTMPSIPGATPVNNPAVGVYSPTADFQQQPVEPVQNFAANPNDLPF